MSRLHLLEIHDQEWCPPSLRDALTRCINSYVFSMRPYRPVADLLVPALTRTSDENVVDLCSGSGGPWPYLAKRVYSRLKEAGRPPVAVMLTDKFPAAETQALPEGVSYLPDSVDATSIDPKQVHGFRTLFTSFHHFKPETATALLADAVKNKQGIAIFEFTRRHPLAVLSFLIVPMFIPIALLFMKKRCLRDWLWTFPIPILPLTVLFDGVVSCLRTYSPAECLELAKAADPDDLFEWESGVKTAMPAGMTYLIGTPKQSRTVEPE